MSRMKDFAIEMANAEREASRTRRVVAIKCPLVKSVAARSTTGRTSTHPAVPTNPDELIQQLG